MATAGINAAAAAPLNFNASRRERVLTRPDYIGTVTKMCPMLRQKEQVSKSLRLYAEHEENMRLLSHSFRFAVALCFFCCVRSGVAFAQNAQPAVQTYDIITVKPHKAGDDNIRISWRDGTWEASNITMDSLIARTYEVRPWSVVGLPAWGKSEHFDIHAKISDPDLAALKDLTAVQRRTMVAGILKDRFHLQMHMETRTLPVYEITVMPGGTKLQESPLVPGKDGGPPQKPQTEWHYTSHRLTGTAVPVITLAEGLSYLLERFVLDKTGLIGRYNLDLRWTPEDDAGTGNQPSAIATALKDQLGLRFTTTKGPVPTVVVDGIDVPGED
jgi:uncharacterized protein (TIGR03435 family)